MPTSAASLWVPTSALRLVGANFFAARPVDANFCSQACGCQLLLSGLWVPTSVPTSAARHVGANFFAARHVGANFCCQACGCQLLLPACGCQLLLSGLWVPTSLLPGLWVPTSALRPWCANFCQNLNISYGCHRL